jgi:exopolyphosphatase / guanosine-5'-triphosphate,3'-diphosphate pyrophosphatase
MRCACIDIGSTTTRLLVAEVEHRRLREVRSERAFLRLGRGGEPGTTLSPRAVERLADTVAAQAALARALKAEHVRTVATAALRGAANRDAVVQRIASVARVAVEVLAPEEEARLAFLGATAALPPVPTTTVGVADVGGGSSELIAGPLGEAPRWIRSLPLGSGLLALRHFRADPPAPAELAAAQAEAGEAFAGLGAPQPDIALAVGGSATSLHRLCGPLLDEDALRLALERLLAGPAARVAAELGLHVERVRILPAGLLLLREAGAAFGAPLAIAGGGLREGVLIEQAVGRDIYSPGP